MKKSILKYTAENLPYPYVNNMYYVSKRGEWIERPKKQKKEIMKSIEEEFSNKVDLYASFLKETIDSNIDFYKKQDFRRDLEKIVDLKIFVRDENEKDYDEFIRNYKNNNLLNDEQKLQILQLERIYQTKEKTRDIINNKPLLISLKNEEKIKQDLQNGELLNIDFLNDEGLNRILQKIDIIDEKKKKDVKNEIKKLANNYFPTCRQIFTEISDDYNGRISNDEKIEENNKEIEKLDLEIKKRKGENSSLFQGLVKKSQNLAQKGIDYNGTFSCPLTSQFIDEEEKDVLDFLKGKK